MYKLCLRKDTIKALKKIKKSKSKSFVEEFTQIFELICNDPINAGEAYVGNLSGFYKFKHGESPEYRIIYSVHEKQEIIDKPDEFEDCEINDEELSQISGIVDVVFLKTREECNNLYKQNSAYFKGKLRG